MPSIFARSAILFHICCLRAAVWPSHAGAATAGAVEQARGSGGARCWGCNAERCRAGAGGGVRRLELPCEVFYPSDLVFASALDMLHLLASLPAFPSPYPYSRGLPSHGLHAWPYPDLLPHASRAASSPRIQELDAPPVEVAPPPPSPPPPAGSRSHCLDLWRLTS